jgi:glycosyltransferase involved in cell wall biosynthesis
VQTECDPVRAVIAIPTFNGAQYVEEALRSLLAQSF